MFNVLLKNGTQNIKDTVIDANCNELYLKKKNTFKVQFNVKLRSPKMFIETVIFEVNCQFSS